MSVIKLYDTYKKVKGVFAKPKLKVYFGLWKNDPNLPLWRRGWFHIFNYDVICKTKYDNWRYEFPPQFTIVVFGVSLTFTLHCPIKDYYSCDDHYWECILEYLCGVGHNSVMDTFLNCGYWSTENCKYHQLRREYLTKDYQKEYDTVLAVFNETHKDIIVL